MSHSGVTSQAGFPRDRGAWLGAAIGFAVVVAAIVIVRGPYGPPISPVGSVFRTLGLLLVAAIPAATLAWAWRRLSRQARRMAPTPVGVLTVLLALLAFAHNGIYLERVRMGRDPARLAASSFQAGDRRFWALEDTTGNLVAPPIANRCLINRYGARSIPGTEGAPQNGRHRRYRERAENRARRYNETMLARLGVSPTEARRFADSFCPD